jgi:hypothetical protein
MKEEGNRKEKEENDKHATETDRKKYRDKK